jgi:hypothetical protein
MSEQLKELFVLNQETMMVDLNKPWISTIKELRVILQRDKGGKGDKQARKKSQAEKEFTFIYHLCDYRSQLAEYSERDRLPAAIDNAGLPKDFDYTKDEELCKAIEVYSLIRETAGLLFLQELKQGLHASRRVARKIRLDLEATLDQAEGLTPEQLKELGGKNDLIVTISDRMDRIIQLAQSLPKTLKAIDELESTIKKELADTPLLRGKSEKGTREDAVGLVTGFSNPFGNE